MLFVILQKSFRKHKNLKEICPGQDAVRRLIQSDFDLIGQNFNIQQSLHSQSPIEDDTMLLYSQAGIGEGFPILLPWFQLESVISTAEIF